MQESSLDPVTKYAYDVLDGDIIAGPHVRDSCKRHIDDLAHADERGFYFDVERVQNIVDFYKEVLMLNGGDFEGVPYELLPWQKFVVGSLFGWVDESGNRRFRVSFIETGKGSGKSPLAAGIGIYGLVADQEPRAEIYAAASKKDQAMILFRDAVAMVDLSPALSERIVKSGRGEKTHNLAYHEEGSFFRPLSADDGQSGPRPHVSLLDEIHEHKNANVVNMIRAGTKGRRQALMFLITNSGHDKTTICWDYHEFAVKVASRQTEDDSFFSYVCGLDKEDEPFKDESCWLKANPSLGVTIQPKYLRELVTQAKGMPSMESVVLRLNFCKWVGAVSPWISADVWLGAKADFGIEFLKGRTCVGGLDLSSTQDLTSLVLVFEPTEADPFTRLLPFFWLPEEGLKKKGDKDGVDYLAWKEKGWLKTTPGKAISKLLVCQFIIKISSWFIIKMIGYDRWRIEDLKQLLVDEGEEIPLEGYGQGYKDMAPAIDEYERQLLNEECKHDGNPVMTWCAANAVTDSDDAGNRKISKKKATGRVDGIVATLNAMGMLLKKDDEPENSRYENKGIRTI